jgi:hypothetical protein
VALNYSFLDNPANKNKLTPYLLINRKILLSENLTIISERKYKKRVHFKISPIAIDHRLEGRNGEKIQGVNRERDI